MEKYYGGWRVLSPEKIKRGNCTYIKCRCECGIEKEVNIKNLKSGISTSCGCRRSKQLSERNYKHGLRFSKEWRSWQAMKNRCYNTNFVGYDNYGGRGITVCNQWLHDFQTFLNDVGQAQPNETLDRVDVNGNYEPSNVRWATRKQQAQNKRNNNKINGVCISEISRGLGGGHSLVAKRLGREWSLEKAITEKSNASS